MQRRTFLKLGLVGGAVVAAGGLAYRGLNPTPTGKLVPSALPILTVVVPVVLGDAITVTGQTRAESINATVARVEQTILGLPLHTQAELNDLFGLLDLAPVRRLLCGVTTPWSQASEQEVAQFLQRIRFHRVLKLQSAYHALRDLVAGAHYAHESTWKALGYVAPSLG